jgi:hypothetical protein
MTTILSDAGIFEVPSTDALWLSAADAERITGWTLKPEGMCRDDACVPLPAAALRGSTVDVEAFWRKLGAPVLHADARDVWVLGASADARNRGLAGETAPDFTLPDLSGKLHTLSSLRGRKVFLATWASW